MFCSLLKNFREQQLKIALRYRLISYKTENIIGGGLEKPHGGLKEEKYFSEQNSNLMAKIRDHGTKPNSYNCDSNCHQQNLSTKNTSTALRESCSITKHKNCLEEAFFLSEQNECCAKLCKDDEKRVEFDNGTEFDAE